MIVKKKKKCSQNKKIRPTETRWLGLLRFKESGHQKLWDGWERKGTAAEAAVADLFPSCGLKVGGRPEKSKEMGEGELRIWGRQEGCVS